MAYIVKTLKTNCFLMFLGHRHHLVVVLLGSFVDGFFVEFSLILGSKINENPLKINEKRDR